MENLNLDHIEAREILPGYKGKFIHSDNMTLVYWDIEANAPFKEHSHKQEQIVNLLDGEFILTVEGEELKLKAGSVVTIPSNVKHSGLAITKCKMLDAFYPVRDDYK